RADGRSLTHSPANSHTVLPMGSQATIGSSPLPRKATETPYSPRIVKIDSVQELGLESFGLFRLQSASDHLQVLLGLPIINTLFSCAFDRAAHEKFRRIEFALKKQNVSQAVESATVDGVNQQGFEEATPPFLKQAIFREPSRAAFLPVLNHICVFSLIAG